MSDHNQGKYDFSNELFRFFGGGMGAFASGGTPTDRPSATSSAASYDDGDEDDGIDWKAKYEELLSDFKSYKRRVENLKETERKSIVKDTVVPFLELVSFIVNTYNDKAGSGASIEDADILIMQKVIDTMENRYGIERMKGLVGTPYDHNLHEALMLDVPNERCASGTITKVFSQGFIDKETKEVLMHAKVAVAG